MARYLVIVVFISFSFLPACKPVKKHFLMDEWLMTTGNQEMIFEDDSTMNWIIKEPTLNDTFRVHYKLDETKNPVQLDLYDFKKGILKGKILAGTLEKIGNDTIVVDFQPADNWIEADSVRPTGQEKMDKRFLVRIK